MTQNLIFKKNWSMILQPKLPTCCETRLFLSLFFSSAEIHGLFSLPSLVLFFSIQNFFKKSRLLGEKMKEGGEVGRRCQIKSVANIYWALMSKLLSYCLSTPYPPFCALLWCWDWGDKPYFFVAKCSLSCPAHWAAREMETVEEEKATSSHLLDSLFLSVSHRQELFTWTEVVCFCFQFVC